MTVAGAAGRALGLIWAQSRNGVIGRGNTIPWRVPEDQRHFRNVTSGGAAIMGRHTWESLPASVRPLPGRVNIVVSRQPGLVLPGALVASSLDGALALVPEGIEAWVVGGAQLYTEALPRATRLVVTHIDLAVDGDARAPELPAGWRLVDRDGWRASEAGPRFRIAHGTRAEAEKAA